ncbi:MAG: rhamnogalacturonan acetylesterase [Chthoniobacteraceae bacterium]
MKQRPQFVPRFHPAWMAGSSFLILCAALANAAELKFDFGANSEAGFTHVASGAAFDDKQGFGFLQGFSAPKPGEPIAPVFAVNVPEGNYNVTIRFGDPKAATSTTIKAESRRLMLKDVETAPGKYETRTITVNVRKPAISTGGVTSLNGRELGPPPVPDWDDTLSLEFNGKNPGVASVEIEPVQDATTVFIAGDSTVTDQWHEPYTGWGQILPSFFQPGIAVSNQAESGLALFSFEHQKRLQKVLSMMKKGDYLFIQFGHNDQKDKSPNAGPFTSYKDNLKKFVEAAKQKGGLPVIVTPMERRRWDKDGKLQPTLADYAEAGRQVASEEQVPLIDLNAMSQKFYTALGADKSSQAFVFYPANTYTGQPKELKDNTHHSVYGAYELARCVVEGIKATVPALASHLVKDAGAFDPSKPDALESIQWSLTPLRGAVEKPAGS